MKRILKKIFWLLLTILFAVIIFCLIIIIFDKNKSKSDTNINTYTVAQWTIEKTVEVYWNAKLVNEEKLAFLLWWDVAEIFVNQWDYVHKWDILATLDTENLDNDILQAEIALENAEINYNELQKWWTNTQILQAENTLAQSKANLELLEQQYDELVENSEIDTLWNSNNTLLKSTVFNIKDYITQGEKALIALDKIFGVSRKYESENNSFEQYLSKKNTSYKRQTERLISRWYNLLENLQDEYNNINTNPTINDKNDILDALDESEDFFENLYETTEYAYKALENSEINETLTTTILWNFESIVSNYSTFAKSNLSAVISTINTIKWLNNSNSTNLAIQAKKNEINTLRDAIKLQEQSLQDIKNWATDSQKDIAANTVRQWEITVNKAKKWIESYQISAPFDWVIRKIDFEVWDKISQTNPKYIYIENPDLIEISLLLDQIDIVQVEEWMTAEVEFDAYPGIIFPWILGEIDTSANINAWVVSYTVKITIDKCDYKIYGWMTANVKIIIDKQEQATQIPTTYIQKIWDKNYVKNNSWDLMEIEIWIENDNMTQIVSWLRPWDKIIKEVSNTATNSLWEEMMSMHDQAVN